MSTSYLVLDLTSGTCFPVDNAVLVDTSQLVPDDLDTLENGGDSDLAELGERVGAPLSSLLVDSLVHI